jgi:hypothetical protein
MLSSGSSTSEPVVSASTGAGSSGSGFCGVAQSSAGGCMQAARTIAQRTKSSRHSDAQFGIVSAHGPHSMKESLECTVSDCTVTVLHCDATH